MPTQGANLLAVLLEPAAREARTDAKIKCLGMDDDPLVEPIAGE
jgi:hypothetical protein